MKNSLIAIMMLWFGFTKAQAPTKFYTTFGGYGHDIGYGVKQTLDGHYIVTGSTSSFGQGNTDVLLAKIDSMGWVRWQKSYGGFNNDIGKQVIQLSDSGFVIAGYTNSFGAGGYDVYVVRTDKNGVLIWQKTFGGMNWDFAADIKQISPTEIVICGNTYSMGRGKSDGYVLKIDLAGNKLKEKTYGGVEDDDFKSFTTTYNGKLAFAGSTKSYGDLKGDCWLFKTDLNCDSVLHVNYGSNRKQNINDIEEHPITHDFHLCGGDDRVGLDSTSAYILGLSETGTFLFEDFHTYHKLKDEQYVALTQIKNNDYIYSRKNAFNPSGDRKLEPMISVYTNAWYVNVTTYGSLEDDELFDVVKTKDKGFVFVGYTMGYNANLSDVFILKLDSINITTAISAVGINETTSTSEKISVFPSLVKDYATVALPKEFKKTRILLKNGLGQLLTDFTTDNNSFQIGMQSYAIGIYFISIESAELSKTFKIIKIE